MKYNPWHVSNSNAENIGGICSFQFVPKEWIANEIELSINIHEALEEVELIPDAVWLDGLSMPGYTGYTEEPKSTPAGIVYTQTVQFKVNKDELRRRTTLLAANYYEFVVVYTDRNGQKRIIGNKSKGMTMLTRFGTGTTVDSNNTFLVELTHESDMPAPGYPIPL